MTYRGWDIQRERSHRPELYNPWWMATKKGVSEWLPLGCLQAQTESGLMRKIDKAEDKPPACPKNPNSSCFFVEGKYGPWPDGPLTAKTICLWCGRIPGDTK